MSLIAVEQLSKDYINDDVTTPVLHGLTFNISAGEFVAIMGPSGSGKSTLMHILGFLDQGSDGSYRFQGREAVALSEREQAAIRNGQLGFVFQSFNLLPKTSVLENVLLPLRYSDKVPSAERVDCAERAVAAVGLAHRMGYLSSQLSGGEKQRVAIARALVNDPAVIFADEPTGNLDSRSGQQVMGLLQTLNDQGRTVILVTHERDTAQHARRIIRLLDGRIVEDRSVDQRRADGQEELQK